MADGTSLHMTEDRRLAVTKQSTDPERAARLCHEADALRRAEHEGVVELLECFEVDGGTALRTAFTGGGTLGGRLASLGVARGAKVTAGLATVLADLHDRGVAHQRVTADHVLVGDGDSIRLCGFGGAALSSEGSSCDPAAAAADVEAVAVLVGEIAEAAGPAGAPLRAVADRVFGAVPAARPGMRTLAQALHAIAGDPDGPAGAGARGRTLLPARSPARSRHPRRRIVVGAVAAVVLLAGTGLAATLAGSGPPPDPTTAPSPPPSVPGTASTPMVPEPESRAGNTTTSPAPEPAGVRVWPPAPPSPPAPSGPCPAPPPSRPAVADVDGDGCGEMVEVAGGVVSVAGRRWQVTAAGGLVAVGDWDCDGIATPAVVHPGTGRIWVYPRWADEGHDVVARPAGSAPGTVSIRAVTVGGEGSDPVCHALEGVDAAGQTTRLQLGS